jgi:5S rRNA maturation endonuclease (ribonuclease M5)
MFPRSREEMMEELIGWVDELNEHVDDILIVVEGKKDIAALTNIGVTANMVHMNKGMSILTFLEKLSSNARPFEDIGHFKILVIMTDWDRTGGRLASKLKEGCKNLGIHCDLDRRRELAQLTGKWIRDVESVDSLIS